MLFFFPPCLFLSSTAVNVIILQPKREKLYPRSTHQCLRTHQKRFNFFLPTRVFLQTTPLKHAVAPVHFYSSLSHGCSLLSFSPSSVLKNQLSTSLTKNTACLRQSRRAVTVRPATRWTRTFCLYSHNLFWEALFRMLLAACVTWELCKHY